MADIPALAPARVLSIMNGEAAGGGVRGAELARADGEGARAVVRLRDRPAADVLALAVLAERDDHLLDQVRVAAHRREQEGEGRDADGDGEAGAAPAHLLGVDVTGQRREVGAAELLRQARCVVALLVRLPEDVPQQRAFGDYVFRRELVQLNARRPAHPRRRDVWPPPPPARPR